MVEEHIKLLQKTCNFFCNFFEGLDRKEVLDFQSNAIQIDGCTKKTGAKLINEHLNASQFLKEIRDSSINHF